MLVLTRKAGQGILISGRITLAVNRIADNRVALAFDAPEDVQKQSSSDSARASSRKAKENMK